MDYSALAMAFSRALRGSRSQVAWSRRLGYRSNVAYSWEKGRRWPTAAEAMRAAERNGVDLDGAFRRFFGKAVPDWVGEYNLTTSRAVAALLDELRGQTTIVELARRTGFSRFAIARWLKGETEPKLPAFFCLLEESSTRLVDFVSEFVAADALPPVAEQVRLQALRRESAFEMPWTQAVVRCLELEQYRAKPAHQPGWIAALIGIDSAHEAACLSLLEQTGQIVWNGTHFSASTVAVDTRGRPEIGRRLKGHWTAEAVKRIEAGADGQFSYVVFAVSKAGFEEIRAAHLRYFNTLRGIIAESNPSEVVGVVNVQLFGLEGEQCDLPASSALKLG